MLDDATWRRLAAHAFDRLGAPLSFTRRLARENRWGIAYAARAVDEYRKFCYLAVQAGHPVTPSDAVDVVWHLHLTYSRDYWNVFCPRVLGKDLHHDPTTGTAAEAGKFSDRYAKTLCAYRAAFGTPPADIWPPPEQRFDAAQRFVRVNSAQTLLVSRARVAKLAVGTLAGSAGLLAYAADSDGSALVIATLGLLAAGFVIWLFFRVRRLLRLQRGGGAHGGGAAAGGFAGCGGGTRARDDKSDHASDSTDGSGCGGSGCGTA